MILVSCAPDVLAKYAEEIGFEKKLVLTEDRLPFRVRAASMFEPFRSRDRQARFAFCVFSFHSPVSVE